MRSTVITSLALTCLIMNANAVSAPATDYVILQPSDEATFSSELAATIGKLNVNEGSQIKTGDVLIELDCRIQQADYTKAIAARTAAESSYKSATRLKTYDAISENELIKAKTDMQIANAEVDKLTAILDKCTVKAPFNGAVASVKVHQFESVRPGDSLIKIVNTDRLVIQMEVASDWLRWLRVNSNFVVHINDINKNITAKIIRVNPEINPVSQSVKIMGEIQPNTDKLLPGMSGQASFPDNPQNLFQKKGLV